ncbi:hypothetical protein KSW81_001156 [Nannochloris sp. 'desiccata']|nr:hypothetical protein KSW81_001156 [Chlorella desiccata (nom. nud.)]
MVCAETMNLILSQFFCVRAEFIPIDSENPLNGFIVSNYENLDRVTDLFLAPRAPPMFVGHRNGTLAGLKPASMTLETPQNSISAVIQQMLWAKSIIVVRHTLVLFRYPESSAVMMEVAEGLGLDTAKLVDVPQGRVPL